MMGAGASEPSGSPIITPTTASAAGVVVAGQAASGGVVPGQRGGGGRGCAWVGEGARANHVTETSKCLRRRRRCALSLLHKFSKR